MNHSNINTNINISIMDTQHEYKLSYPKSINNKQCVGPCYFPNTQFIHPLTLDELVDESNAICPIKPYTKKNKSTGVNEIIDVDDCKKPTDNKSKIDDLFISSITTPETYFNSEFFIKIFYGIKSLDEMFQYIDNDLLPFRTKQRIFDISFSLFGNNQIVSNEIMKKFYNEIIDNGMDIIITNIKPYLEMKNSKISIVKNIKTNKNDNNNKNNNKISDKHIEKYIRSKLLNDTDSILMRFIRKETNRLSDEKLSHILLRYTNQYIINKIKNTK